MGSWCGLFYILQLTILNLKFHLGCVGLTEPPDGEWYCEDCREDE